jgi:hypothetical protein
VVELKLDPAWPPWRRARQQARALVTAASSNEPNAAEISRGVLKDVLNEITGDGEAMVNLIAALDILAADAVSGWAKAIDVAPAEVMQQIAIEQERG